MNLTNTGRAISITIGIGKNILNQSKYCVALNLLKKFKLLRARHGGASEP